MQTRELKLKQLKIIDSEVSIMQKNRKKIVLVDDVIHPCDDKVPGQANQSRSQDCNSKGDEHSSPDFHGFHIEQLSPSCFYCLFYQKQ